MKEATQNVIRNRIVAIDNELSTSRDKINSYHSEINKLTLKIDSLNAEKADLSLDAG